MPLSYIIISIALLDNNYLLSYTFYKAEYITTNISFSSNRIKLSIYLNSSYLIILKDREFLYEYIIDFKLKLKYIATYILV